MSIYVTGDIHGDPSRLGSNLFRQGRNLTKEDYVIIAGDFGLIWDKDVESSYEKHWLDWLENKPFTTLFIDGNHENYDRLNTYPVEEWCGGRVQKIRPSVIHLMRGEIFRIDGVKILAMGGARSHDISDGILEIGDPRIEQWETDYMKMFRVNHLSWWKEEVPTPVEMDNCLDNLQLHNHKVDFIITHEAPASTIALFSGGLFHPDAFSKFLERLRWDVDYKHWYFGHYHDDRRVTEQETMVYETITRIA